MTVGKASFLINVRIKGFHVGPIHCIDASHASFKYLAGRRNESNTNHYPISDDEIVAVANTSTSKTCISCCFMLAGSVPKSAQRE
jgi:hypothetical protein